MNENKSLFDKNKSIPSQIFHWAEEWETYYQNNNAKCNENTRFIAGEQWDSVVRAERLKELKPCVVYNEVKKIIEARRAEVAALEIGIDLYCTKENKNHQEEEIVKGALEYFLLQEQYCNHYTKAYYE